MEKNNPLSDKMGAMLRNKLFEVTVIINDELSMISIDLLLYTYLRLIDIWLSQYTPLAGITIIAVRDLLQLALIRVKQGYADTKIIGKT